MSESEILLQITDVMRRVFKQDDLTITPATVAGDVERWTSIRHIHLVVEIEKHFKVKFKSLEIQKWANVGDLIKSVSTHLQKKP
jgi:acyl carrier protein